MKTATAGAGDAIYRARIEADLTQEELAERCGVSQPTISKLEKGTTKLTERSAVRIGRALGIDILHLIDEDDGRTSAPGRHRRRGPRHVTRLFPFSIPDLLEHGAQAA